DRAVTLFLCSYAVGMMGDVSARLPLGLSPLGESAAALAVALWAGGWALAAAGLGTMLAIQVADDLWDRGGDAGPCAGHRARRWGPVGAAGAGRLGVLGACWIGPRLPVQALVAVAVLQSSASRFDPGPKDHAGPEPAVAVPQPGEGG